MKNNLIVLLIFVFGPLSISAQFGVSARIQNSTNKSWNDTYQLAADTSQNLFSRSFEFGINYWFRLKDYRIEFLPEISYATSNNDKLFSGLAAKSHSRSSYNFNFNVQIYPLDFIGDCNCPTFSKDGNVISKGFYWLLSPGLSMHNIKTQYIPDVSRAEQSESMIGFRFGIGAGLDFGLTQMVTVSPFAMYSMNFGNAWPEQYQIYGLDNVENSNNAANIKQWHLGMRLIFRPDYKR